MTSQSNSGSLLQRLQSNTTASKADRLKNVRDIKDLCKDVFEIAKNSLVVATIQAAAATTNNFTLYWLSKILFFFLMAQAMCLMFERSSMGIKYNAKGFISLVVKMALVVAMVMWLQTYLLSTIQQLVVIGMKCKV